MDARDEGPWLPDIPEVPIEGRLALSESLRNLVDLAKEVRSAVLSDAGRPAYVGWIPPRAGGAELPAELVPETLEGDPARERLAPALTRLTYYDTQHAKSSLRLPGLLGCSPTTLGLLRRFNDAKATFESEASALTAKQWEAMRRRGQFARLSLLYAYRRVPILEDGLPESVSFSWLSQPVSLKRLTVAQARRLIVASLASQYELSEPARQEMLQEQLGALKHLPAEELLAMRRPLQPVPQATLRYGENDARTCKAILPFAFPARPGSTLMPFRKLPSTDTAHRPPGRPDAKVEDRPLLRHLHLYRYRPQYRLQHGDASAGLPGPEACARAEGCTLLFGPAEPPVSLVLDDATAALLKKALLSALRAGVHEVPTSAGTLRVIHRRASGVSVSLHGALGECLHAGRMSRADVADFAAPSLSEPMPQSGGEE